MVALCAWICLIPRRIADEKRRIKHRDPSNLGNSLSFTFDHIFGIDSTQKEIYGEVGQGLVGKRLD